MCSNVIKFRPRAMEIFLLTSYYDSNLWNQSDDLLTKLGFSCILEKSCYWNGILNLILIQIGLAFNTRFYLENESYNIWIIQNKTKLADFNQ